MNYETSSNNKDILTDDDSDTENEIEPESCNNYGFLKISILILFTSLLFGKFLNEGDPRKINFNLNDLKTSLPKQDPSFWLIQESTLNLTINHNKLSTIIYLYFEEKRDVINKFLNKLAKHVLKQFTQNQIGPIVVNSSELNSIGSKDYGILIDMYGNMLISQHVMIVHDFDKLRGSVALAFKWLCDEYISVNSKNIFLFTMKVNKIEPNTILDKIVFRILSQNWSNELKTDQLKSLLTRVMGTIIAI